MSLSSLTEFECPYCGFKNKYRVDKAMVYEIVYCDCENGGCDEPFAVKIEARVKTSVEVFSLARDAEVKLSGYQLSGLQGPTAVSVMYKGKRFDFVADYLVKPPA